MPFDGIVTRAVTNELQQSLTGGRVNKIYQPTKTEIVLTVRHNRQNHSLLLSIHPSYARFHLTDDTYRNPNEPPMFCMLLRKHIGGAIIEDITQVGLERNVSIEFRGVNEIWDHVSKKIMIEIKRRYTNKLVCNRVK